MNQFMGVMTDPFAAGRGDGVSAGGGATGYADEQGLAYAARRNPDDALAAIYRKAPVAETFAQRWNVWAAGFGGSQTTNGNAALGSNNTACSRCAVARPGRTTTTPTAPSAPPSRRCRALPLSSTAPGRPATLRC